MDQNSQNKTAKPGTIYRRKKRQFVFEQLFMSDFYPSHEIQGQLERSCADEDMMEELNATDFSEEDLASMKEKVARIAARREELDKQIDAVATFWRTDRMGRTELTLLRLALYEMTEDEDVPYPVAINEAVELAKIYGGEDAPVFINGVLRKLVTALGLESKESAQA